jgi:acyl-homoserine lactone acylase PvdQ
MKTIEIKWSTDDVLILAEQMGAELSEQQADEILDRLLRNHDADVGINWGVIEYHIENLIYNQTKQ